MPVFSELEFLKVITESRIIKSHKNCGNKFIVFNSYRIQINLKLP